MDIKTFLAHAVKLELEAEKVYRVSAELFDSLNNVEAAAFFLEMAGFSHKHCEEAMRRAGFKDLTELPEAGYQWPNGTPPESPEPVTPSAILDGESAITVALAAEKGAVAFYETVSASATDPQVISMAKHFAEEEHSHVLALERFAGLKPY